MTRFSKISSSVDREDPQKPEMLFHDHVKPEKVDDSELTKMKYHTKFKYHRD